VAGEDSGVAQNRCRVKVAAASPAVRRRNNKNITCQLEQSVCGMAAFPSDCIS
jgi:hypothetical protein